MGDRPGYSCLPQGSFLLSLCNAVPVLRILQVRFTGPDARPGQIAAADVARVITGLERAIARAAYLALGRPRQGLPAGILRL